MRNIEKLRNYFLGKDPQLKETMADNSLRLIGIPGREFVLRVELLKRLGLLKKELTDKDTELQGLIDDLETALNNLAEKENRDVTNLENAIDAEETTRANEDLALNRRVDLNAVDIANLDTWKNNTDFVLADDLAEALTDYYTKDEVDAIISVLPTFDVRVVIELPSPLEGEFGVLYLVPSDDPGDVNYYDEYVLVQMMVDDAPVKFWEKVGSTQIDMSDYYTKSETNSLLAGKQGTLTAGSNIQINGNTISATDTTYTAGTNITIDADNVISATGGGSSYTAGDYIDITNGEISVAGIVPETTEINNYVADTSIEGATGFPIEFYPNYTNYTYCSYTNNSNNEETYSFKVKGSIVDSSIIYRADANGIALYVDSTYQAMWEDYHDVQLTLPAGGTAYFQFYYNPEYPDPSFPQPSVLMVSSDGAVLNDYTRFSDTFIGTDGNTDGAPGVVPAPTSGDTNKYLKSDGTWAAVSAGSSDYDDLTDKPQINSVTLSGNKTSADLGLDMVILSYGNSTWQDFLSAYNRNAVVYCRASSNSDPSSGSQTRLAFMAYVNNAASPTEVEFQYYRSVSSKTASQQGDQVFVYKLTSASGGTWTVTTRENGSKVVAGTNMTSSYSNGVLTLNATGGSGEMNTIDSISVNGVAQTPDANKNVDLTIPTITYGTTDLTPGTSTLNDGEFYFVYD